MEVFRLRIGRWRMKQEATPKRRVTVHLRGRCRNKIRLSGRALLVCIVIHPFLLTEIFHHPFFVMLHMLHHPVRYRSKCLW
ncbi:MAG: hypothetical protein CVV31_11225 [Methanomicrobiales archaeon HGW-Methanomicrobiales-2]|nr:MAG: hypothetical protein CVV34_02540 [Methanomicrobiales archaeon HGW-Methanomicrobiales-5]PKL61452.1 MAG: hypothetical protein CVV31_11225 [Methanomicrobiales archaeon HGW-Methanomicrobiales-2]